MTRVLGVDPSYTRTGIATHTPAAPREKPMTLLRQITAAIAAGADYLAALARSTRSTAARITLIPCASCGHHRPDHGPTGCLHCPCAVDWTGPGAPRITR